MRKTVMVLWVVVLAIFGMAGKAEAHIWDWLQEWNAAPRYGR